MPDAHVPGAIELAVPRVFIAALPLAAAPVTVINPLAAVAAIVPTLAPPPLAPEVARELLGSLLSALHAPSIKAKQRVHCVKELGDGTVVI